MNYNHNSDKNINNCSYDLGFHFASIPYCGVITMFKQKYRMIMR